MTRIIVDADVSLPATPYQAKNGYMVMNTKALGKPTYVHRWIAEKCLGRPLPEGALVHHVNYDKTDNRRCNLVVCPDDAYHQLLHTRTDILNAEGKPEIHKICCGPHKALLLRTEFSPSNFTSDGLSAMCRACSNARRRGKGYRNSAAYEAKRRADPVRMAASAAYKAAWYQANKAKKRAK